MDRYLFGQSISRTFYALEDNEPFPIPSQAPAIYLFSSRPTFEAASLGTDAIQTVNYWSHDATSPYPRTYNFSPVSDPSPGGTSYTRQYWEGVNWYNDLAQQIQTIIRSFEIERTEELDSIPGTTVADITAVYPKITSYLSNNELTSHLAIALDEFKIDLEAQGIEYHQAFRLRRAKYALAYKAISISSLSQIQELNDKHYIRWEQYDQMYRGMLSKIQLPTDLDGDNEPDEIAELNQSVFINER